MCYSMELVNATGIQKNERSLQAGIDQRLENFFCKRSNSKYFRLCTHKVAVRRIQLCGHSAKTAIDNTSMNDQGCVYEH